MAGGELRRVEIDPGGLPFEDVVDIGQQACGFAAPWTGKEYDGPVPVSDCAHRRSGDQDVTRTVQSCHQGAHCAPSRTSDTASSSVAATRATTRASAISSG